MSVNCGLMFRLAMRNVFEEHQASKPMPDGEIRVPGGWSRFVLDFENLDSVVSKLKDDGVKFKNEIVEGPGVNRFSVKIRPVI